MEHYECVVDLLGYRAGLWALDVQKHKNLQLGRMPFEPDASVLGALMGACKMPGTIELGNEVAKRIICNHNIADYMYFCQLYAEAADSFCQPMGQCCWIKKSHGGCTKRFLHDWLDPEIKLKTI